jgi:hypothetical protein
MPENIVVLRSDRSPPPPAPVPDARARLEVIEATLTIEKAVAAGVVDQASSDSMRLMLLNQIIRSIDLIGLEHCDAKGSLIGIIADVGRKPEAESLFDLWVHLDRGEDIELWRLGGWSFYGFGFLRLPGSTATGLAATLEALRSRVEARP